MNWRNHLALLAALALGALTGVMANSLTLQMADIVAQLFVHFLQLISLPIIFFAIVSTLANMDSHRQLQLIGRKVFLYTLTTTLVAASIGLLLLVISGLTTPVGVDMAGAPEAHAVPGRYLDFFLKIIPPNALGAFTEGNVLGIAFMGFALGMGILHLPTPQKAPLQGFFRGFFGALLNVATWLIGVLPIGVWAFTTLLVDSWMQTEQHDFLLWYAIVVIAANLLQGFLVLPLFLRANGIAPWKAFGQLIPALATAFFTKSSNATMPLTLRLIKEKVGVKEEVANTSIPLCSVINMNGCAAFILITVIFVATQHGLVFDPIELVLWIGIATLAAVGNAGVPMGCYFLTSAFLLSLDVPLTMLGLILPMYAFFDMLETAINVWSDCCVTMIVDKQLRTDARLTSQEA